MAWVLIWPGVLNDTGGNRSRQHSLRIVCYANNHLAEVFTGQQTDKGLRRILQTVSDLLTVVDFTLFNPAPHLPLKLMNAVTIILTNDKTLHPDTLFQ